MKNKMSIPIFIVGTGRSGTTLLRLMLNSHPDLAIPYETHFIPDYAPGYQSEDAELSDTASDALLIKILNEPTVQQWEFKPTLELAKRHLLTKNASGCIDAVYSAYAEGLGKSRWGDKSGNLSKMHVLASLFPDSCFVHIVRDGRDVANSMLKLPWGGGDIIEIAEWWRNAIKLSSAVGSALGKQRYLEIKFEDLIAEPEQTLRLICDFSGMPFSDRMLDFHETADASIPSEMKYQHANVNKPPELDRVAVWKREMSKSKVELFNAYASEQLLQMGYEVSPRSWSHRKMDVMKIMVLIKRAVLRLFQRGGYRAGDY